MITKEEFFKFIKSHQEFNEFVSKLDLLDIDISETPLFQSFGVIEDLLINCNFNPKGIEKICENLFSVTNINYSKEDLWESVKDYRI